MTRIDKKIIDAFLSLGIENYEFIEITSLGSTKMVKIEVCEEHQRDPKVVIASLIMDEWGKIYTEFKK